MFSIRFKGSSSIKPVTERSYPVLQRKRELDKAFMSNTSSAQDKSLKTLSQQQANKKYWENIFALD